MNDLYLVGQMLHSSIGSSKRPLTFSSDEFEGGFTSAIHQALAETRFIKVSNRRLSIVYLVYKSDNAVDRVGAGQLVHIAKRQRHESRSIQNKLDVVPV